jgi:hypothetical protein
LQSIIIPDGVNSLGELTFGGCEYLTNVIFSKNITRIGVNAFSGCASLRSVELPESLQVIAQWAFRETSISSITIPSSVTYIGPSAFDEMLIEVYCKPSTPPTASTSYATWEGLGKNNKLKIYVPMESVATYKTTAGWSEYVDNIEGYSFE